MKVAGGILLIFQLIGSGYGFTSMIPIRQYPNDQTFTTTIYLDGQGMAGGNPKHILGDVLRSLQPRYLSQLGKAVFGNARGPAIIDTSMMIDNAPSWAELSSDLSGSQTKEERMYRSRLEKGEGTPSALAHRRLFGALEPRVVFYRDSAAWCPYCQKVWIALEEKRVPYEVVKIDMRCYGAAKPTEFLRLQPNGNLPCAIFDGKLVIRESDDIVDAIDEIGPTGTPRLRPPQGTDLHERLVFLCDDGRNSLERRLYSRWMWWLTGVRKPDEYRMLYEEHLNEVEAALAAAPDGGPFFLGKQISLADIRFIPFLERQLASFAYFKGFDARDVNVRPRLCAWLDAMEQRPSYQATKSDYYTHSRALPPQLAADCQPEAGCEGLRNSIDALPVGDPSSWDDDGVDGWFEAGWEWCRKDIASSRREAAERLIYNEERVVSFASRAAGTPGLPASAAPLANPRAVVNAAALPAVDLFLRHIVNNLIQNGCRPRKTSRQRGDISDAIEVLAAGGCEAEGGNADTVLAIANCLDYLRARVGVPRDMSHPAAQELREELGILSSELRYAVLNEVGDGVGSLKTSADVVATL